MASLKSYSGLINIFLLLLLGGCKKSVKVFPPFYHKKSYYTEKNDLEVCAKVFSEQDCKDYFGVNVKNSYFYPHYEVIHLLIHNKSDHKYILKPSYINLPLISGKHIAQLMHWDTSTWMIYLTIPSLIFFWPAIPGLVVPAGIGMKKYNDKVNKSLIRKCLHKHETLEILPYEYVQKFLFFSACDDMFDFEISFLKCDTSDLLTFKFPLCEKK